MYHPHLYKDNEDATSASKIVLTPIIFACPYSLPYYHYKGSLILHYPINIALILILICD